ncbi:MAG: DUF86 domain-containing protein [bacterium]
MHENGIVDDELLGTMREMVRFRNRLVHLYGSVDDKMVYHFLTTELGDFQRYRAAIMAYLKRKLQ